MKKTLIFFLITAFSNLIIALSFLAQATPAFAQQCIEERDHASSTMAIEGTYLFYCNQLSCTHSPDANGNDVYALRCDSSNAVYYTYRSGRITDQCAIFPQGEGGYHYLPTGQACECLAYQIDWMSRDASNNLVNVGWTMDDAPQTNCSVVPSPTVTPRPSVTPSPTPTKTPTPSKTPTPTPTVKITLTPTPTTKAHSSSCDGLTIISGNNSLVPATIKFEAKASDSENLIRKYKFYFGDGDSQESYSNQINHYYDTSGTFTARVEIQDSQYNWQSSSACVATVTIRPSEVESHKSACSDLFITAGNYAYAPTTVNFTVTGYDNKGNLQAYKLNFGDNQSAEQSTNSFSHYYSQAGTYTVYAYVKDSQGNWLGGSNGCVKAVTVKTASITQQPETGANLVISAFGLLSGITGLSLSYLKKRFS